MKKLIYFLLILIIIIISSMACTNDETGDDLDVITPVDSTGAIQSEY